MKNILFNQDVEISGAKKPKDIMIGDILKNGNNNYCKVKNIKKNAYSNCFTKDYFFFGFVVINSNNLRNHFEHGDGYLNVYKEVEND